MFIEWLMFVIKVVTLAAIAAVPALMLIGSRLKEKKKKSELKIESEDDGDGTLTVVPLLKYQLSRKNFIKKALADTMVLTDDELRDEQEKAQNDGKLSKKSKKAKKKKEKELQKSEHEEMVKAETARQEKISKIRAEGTFCPRNLYVLDYDGDVKASGNDALRREIDAVLDCATAEDEVVLRLTSPGGMVNTYGLASSELVRIRERGIHLTVCVDEVAASGGYLMACVGEKIVAAPFAYIGSIGVVMSLPNFNKVLKKHDVDYEQITAGKYKRTVTVLGENTKEGIEKTQSELEAVHQRFKAVVSRYRQDLDIEKIATGEHWLAEDAKERGLVDEIMTSDDYIAARCELTSGSAVAISWDEQEKQSKLQKILKLFSAKALVSAVADELDKRMLSQKNLH